MKNNNSQLIYEQLSPELIKRITEENPDKFTPSGAIRRDMSHDKENIWRPAYSRDVDKIMHSAYYNRYTDKTQVFSFYKNDDISHRAFHVQLVSRIARSIGAVLGLNLDLIEAIALGHDMGHTPFGHAGERFLSRLYNAETGRYFNHNIQSARVLDTIFPLNLTLQTLDGIICHNGEFECKEFTPRGVKDFADFDARVEKCNTDESEIKKLVPATLEGCVVRLCDMIAYIGKDRQDAQKAGFINDESVFKSTKIGKHNATMINNLIVNIIENSYGKNYIKLDKEHFESLRMTKKDNYAKIYLTDSHSDIYDTIIAPMFEKLYYRLLDDLIRERTDSVIYKHHIDFVNHTNRFKKKLYDISEPNLVVCDYIASMTDDYFIDLYEFLFGEKSGIEYKSYFEDIKSNK